MTDIAAPERHALNRGFEWVEHLGPFRRISPSQARHYDSHGFFVLSGALAPGEVDALVDAIDPFEAEQEAALRTLEGGRLFIARADEITFTVHLVSRSPALREFTRCPLLVDLCADLLGPNARLYWDQAVYKKPGTDASVPLAPGQRLCVRRTAAVPDLLGRPHRRHGRERLPLGRSGVAPERDARPPFVGHGLGVSE